MWLCFSYASKMCAWELLHFLHSSNTFQADWWLFLVVVIRSLSCIQLFVTAWTTTVACQAPLSSTSFQSSSHPLPPPSPFAFSLSQHQDLFQWVNSSHQVAKVLQLSASVLPMNIQDWFPLGLTSLISLQSQGLSTVFSNITFQEHPFFGIQLSLWSDSHIHTWLLENP